MQSSFQKQYIQLNSEMAADVMLKSEQETHRTTTQLLKQVPSNGRRDKCLGSLQSSSLVQRPAPHVPAATTGERGLRCHPAAAQGSLDRLQSPGRPELRAGGQGHAPCISGRAHSSCPHGPHTAGRGGKPHRLRTGRPMGGLADAVMLQLGLSLASSALASN